jgi:von Willebrand factor type D domain
VRIPYKSPTFHVYNDGTCVRCDVDFGLSVTFDGVWTITVSVPDVYAGKMTGISGNNDEDPNNDLILANGTDVSNSTNAFNLVGDSYLVPDREQPDIT